MRKPALEFIIGEELYHKIRKFPGLGKIVDTTTNTVPSLIAGCVLDYVSTLDTPEIVITRIAATILNAGFGSTYGKYRDVFYCYAAQLHDHVRRREYIADVAVYNAFHTSTYGLAIAAGNLAVNRQIDWSKIGHGMFNLFLVSFVTAPILGWMIDEARKECGLMTARELASLSK